MKKMTRKKTESTSLAVFLGPRLREGLLLLTGAVSLFLLLALFTYHKTDPGWSHTSFTGHVANAGGRVGAWIADVLLYFFGYVAYFFPFMLTYAAWLSFQQRYLQQDFKYHLFTLRAVGFIVIILTGCALLSMHMRTAYLPFTSGGVLGNGIGREIFMTFNDFGGSLILVAFLLIAVTLFTGLSWLKVADVTGRLTFFGTSYVYAWLASLSWRRAKSSLADELEEEKQQQKPSPHTKARIEPKLALTRQEKVAPVIAKPKTVVPSVKAQKARQVSMFNDTGEDAFPSLSLLDLPDRSNDKGYTQAQLEHMSEQVELHLQDFGIEAKVAAVYPGPVVTRFELQLAAGTKVSKISTLAKDLARSLSVVSVRIVEVIPGKPVIGLELPNEHREIVRLHEVLASQQYDNARSPLSLALGKDIAGHPVIVDLAKMPHLLVAGTTGSGKSVGLNAMLLSLLYKAKPSQLRLIMIDPKMLELSIYEGIPHLLTPVVTNMKEAANALRWCVAEMERRYRLMASLGVRNITGYNNKVKEARKKGAPLLDPLWQQDVSEEPEHLQELPYIVVLADEFADMMMVVGKKVEELIARIAQKARAAGIHLILATQRPSVDVITGLIKANIPTRIAFQVSSRIDSRTILDQQGAEQLLGHGDMLYLPPGTAVPVRVHGAFVDDNEVHRVVEDLKKQGEPDYLEEVLSGAANNGDALLPGETNGEDNDGEQDPLYDQAVRIVTETRRASISSIQRRLKIGYNRAARIIETMEQAGVVSPMESNGTREVIAPPPIE